MTDLSKSLSHELESWIPPEVKMVTGTIFLYFIARGTNMIEILKGNNTDPRVQCRYSYENVLYSGWNRTGNVSQSVELVTNQSIECYTSEKAAFQCQRVILDGTYLYIKSNTALMKACSISSLENGTKPLSDVFWMCDDDKRVTVVLPSNWTDMHTSYVNRANNST